MSRAHLTAAVLLIFIGESRRCLWHLIPHREIPSPDSLYTSPESFTHSSACSYYRFHPIIHLPRFVNTKHYYSIEPLPNHVTPLFGAGGTPRRHGCPALNPRKAPLSTCICRALDLDHSPRQTTSPPLLCVPHHQSTTFSPHSTTLSLQHNYNLSLAGSTVTACRPAVLHLCIPKGRTD